MFGLNPYVGAAPRGSSIFGTRHLSGLSEERHEICERAGGGYRSLFNGEETPFSIWDDFYSAMCEEILRERQKLGGDWVINQVGAGSRIILI